MNWGIIGTGKIAHKFASDLQLVEGVELYAVGSRDITRAYEFAEAHQVKNSHGSYRDLFNDDAVDIVYIATPHHIHARLAVEALKAGKHVLVEKPVAVNTIQLRELIAVAKDSDRFIMEALWSRFNPTINKALELIQGGEIGMVNYVNADFAFARDHDEKGRLLNPDLAGGSLLDIGIYPLFLSYMIFGYPIEIKAIGRMHRTGVDEQTAAVLKFEDGVSVMKSGLRSQSEMVARIHGTEGSIFLEAPWHESESLKLEKGGQVTSFTFRTPGFGYTYEIEECRDCIRNGRKESDKWTLKNSLDLIRMMDEIRGQIGLRYPFE